MTLNISNLFYTEKDVGLNLYKSKREFVWGFDLDGTPAHIKFLDSRLTNKKRIYKNGDLIFYTKSKTDFSHDFEVYGHHCVIIQYADKFELRIDGESFTHLYNLQKNKELFKKSPTTNINNNNNINKVKVKTIEKDKNNEMVFYKENKTNGENLFNFKIKKNNEQKSTGFKKIFKFGKNDEKYNTINYSNNFNTINVNKTNANVNKILLNLDDSNSIKMNSNIEPNGCMKNNLFGGKNNQNNNQLFNFE